MTPDDSAVDYSVTTLQSTSDSHNIPMDNPSHNSALTAILTDQGNVRLSGAMLAYKFIFKYKKNI